MFPPRASIYQAVWHPTIWSRQIARCRFRVVWSLWHLTGASTVVMPMRQSNCGAIRSLNPNNLVSTVASFTKEVNSRLVKRPLKTNGRLANRELTSLEIWWRVLVLNMNRSPGVGLLHSVISSSLNHCQTLVPYWISHSNLAGVAAVNLQWYLPSMNVTQESNRYFHKIENFSSGKMSKLSFSNPHPRQVQFSTADDGLPSLAN